MAKLFCNSMNMFTSDIDETINTYMGGCRNSKYCNPDDCEYCEAVYDESTQRKDENQL